MFAHGFFMVLPSNSSFEAPGISTADLFRLRIRRDGEICELEAKLRPSTHLIPQGAQGFSRF